MLIILGAVVMLGILLFKIEEYYAPIRHLINKTNMVDVNLTEYKVVEVASGLSVPWSIVFTSPERILVTERIGNIRVIEIGNLLKTPLHTFSEVVSDGEEGLMSLALHPNYTSNKIVYASLAYMKNNMMIVKVVSFKDNGDSVSEVRIIMDDIPAAQYHAGCRLAFGPDKKLYITTGDAGNKNAAQDLNSLAGKILRVNDDGSIPSDNPFPNSAVWSYGHRNPQGIAWDSAGSMFETEHGPSTFDGPPGGDEVNMIVRGGNYGWPLVSHERKLEGTISPILVYGSSAEAPASLLVYSGKIFTIWRDNLFFGALRGEGLMHIVLDRNNKVTSYEKFKDINLGRIRDVAESPTGEIYFSTSNRDGRGKAASNDDRIFKIVQ
jgi:aldose sugar dehydrogenase